jgi:hypothetical protein
LDATFLVVLREFCAASKQPNLLGVKTTKIVSAGS